MSLTRLPFQYFKLITHLNKSSSKLVFPKLSFVSATFEGIEIVSTDIVHCRTSFTNDGLVENNNERHKIRENKETDISNCTSEQISETLLELIAKNKDKKVEKLVLDCIKTRKFISDAALKKILRHYSDAGKPNFIEIVQKYSAHIDINLLRRNGEFKHYLAKAQCMKGNSETGLSILKDSYRKYASLRGFYRIIFKELIQDSVLNRSEASLVIFKKYVLEFSNEFDEHYPLVCFWHISWYSTWYSDHLLADELFDVSQELRSLVADKATAFSISALKDHYNEDAVFRLMQCFLKHAMMAEYTKVLQVLFEFKLRNHDLRGCTEIVRNCEALDIQLSPDQQGRYIRMLIKMKTSNKPQTKTTPVFKLKF